MIIPSLFNISTLANITISIYLICNLINTNHFCALSCPLKMNIGKRKDYSYQIVHDAILSQYYLGFVHHEITINSPTSTLEQLGLFLKSLDASADYPKAANLIYSRSATRPTSLSIYGWFLDCNGQFFYNATLLCDGRGSRIRTES